MTEALSSLLFIDAGPALPDIFGVEFIVILDVTEALSSLLFIDVAKVDS